MPRSSITAFSPLRSTSRENSENSDWTAASGWTAWALRIVVADASDSPMCRTLPAATSSAIAPTDSSIGTWGSTRCR